MKYNFFVFVSILVTLLQHSEAQAVRPDYPWDSNLPYAIGSGRARHHIIPWEELVTFGVAKYTERATLETFLKDYAGISHVRISYATIDELLDAYFPESGVSETEARSDVESLFAWMQGNLVVGPEGSRRNNDPGSAFDAPALVCRQYYQYNFEYINLRAKWEGGNNAVRKKIFETLSRENMVNIRTVRQTPLGCTRSDLADEAICIWNTMGLE